MKIKKITIILIIICIFLIDCIFEISKDFAKNTSQISINSSNNHVDVNEKFTIEINADNTNIAAYTLWIYYESEKVECISQIDNINIQENTIIYTWYSGNGKNKSLDNMLKIEFTPKQEGNVTFSVVGKFYNENGEEIAIQGNTLDILVGDKNLIVESQNDDEASLLYEVQNDDNSVNLGIMRTNNEGINPDFDENILEYYLIVDETINDLEITAIPVSKKAEVIISGNKNLKNGLNLVRVTVSLNGNSKTYTIHVTKTNNAEEANANLATLAIENYTLEPEYQNNVTNYNVEIANTDNSVNILAIAEYSNANVKIEGNETLKYGNNKITVTVKASDGITEKKYNIDVYKRNEEEENLYEENVKQNTEELNQILEENSSIASNMDNESSENNTKLEEKNINKDNSNVITIVIIVVAIIVIGITIIIVKKRLT